MTSRKGLLIGLVVMLAAAAAIFGSEWKAVGQSAQIKTAKASGSDSATPAPSLGVERLSAAANPAAETGAAAAAGAAFFAAASLRNVELQDNLSWAFGGKSQRGWRLRPAAATMVI